MSEEPAGAAQIAPFQIAVPEEILSCFITPQIKGQSIP